MELLYLFACGPVVRELLDAGWDEMKFTIVTH
jgi:hypothetical protein